MKATYMSLSEIQSKFSFVLLFNASILVSVFDEAMYPK